MNKSSLHKKAFTLVELIIVIVIIGILVSAIFLSYTNYSWKARDANRISDLWNIKEVIEKNLLIWWNLEEPDDKENMIVSKEWNNWEVWVFWSKNYEKYSDLLKVPSDPSSNEFYKFSVSDDKKYYIIETVLENWEIYRLDNIEKWKKKSEKCDIENWFWRKLEWTNDCRVTSCKEWFYTPDGKKCIQRETCEIENWKWVKNPDWDCKISFYMRNGFSL